MKLIAITCAVFITASVSLADTFIVDSALGAGADFAQIQEALDSPLVEDGVVLQIRPGVYAAISTNKGVTLEGLGSDPADVKVSPVVGFSSFSNCTSSIRLVNLSFGDLYLDECSATIHMIESRAEYLSLTATPDVRLEDHGSLLSPNGVWVNAGAHVELVNSRLMGGENSTGGPTALVVSGGGFARVAYSSLRGGSGSSSPIFGLPAGQGGHALRISGADSEVHFIGGPGSSLTGGNGGIGDDIGLDGPGGHGILASLGAKVRISAYEVAGGFEPFGGPQAAPTVTSSGASIEVAASADAGLRRFGQVVPGQQISLVVRGEPGALAFYFVGLAPQLTMFPGVIGEQATGYDFQLAKRTLNGEGLFELPIPLPANLEIGELVTAQALVFYSSDAAARFTNPVTLLFASE